MNNKRVSINGLLMYSGEIIDKCLLSTKIPLRNNTKMIYSEIPKAKSK